MGSMREIRTRISSVQSTMKITNAMYLLSSSKLKKARNRLTATAPYFLKIQETMADILAHTPNLENPYFATDEERRKGAEGRKPKRLYLVITSDKGLAGAYNHNVIKLAEQQLDPEAENTMLFVGYNGHNYFKKAGTAKLDEEFAYPAADPEDWRALYLAHHILDLYAHYEADEVFIIYTKMLSALSSDAEVLQLLPLKKGMFGEAPQGENYETVFEPSPDAVLQQLVPNYVKGVIFGAMVEAFCAEQNARMQAMDNATSNAKEMVKNLSLLYNRVRQAAITQEITEVVGGAEAQK